MAADPPELKSEFDEEDPKWLLQFYSASKSTHQVDADTPEMLPDFAISAVEKYRVGEELGSGGMKSVLRTFESHTERNVAMAVLRDPSTRWKKMARFVREARITAALEHPNIVPVYDIGLDAAGKPYFTMKLLGGETLQSILQRVHAAQVDYRTRYPLNSLLQIFQGICNAMNFAHSRGVIHLDIKPGNVQVGDFGEVLVLDWGLARVLEKNPSLYPNRLVIDKSLREISFSGVSGTPGFMSPEQARGENDTLDERTDIYALGAILYAILNCRKSAAGNTGRRAARENAKIPAALEAVAVKAMSAQPEHRYQTVDELARDVRAYVEGYATEAQHAGALTLLWLLIKRHSVVVSLVSVSLVVLMAILVRSDMKIRASEQEARRNELLALDSLQKIKDEQERAYANGMLAAPQVLQQAREAFHVLNYDQAVSLLERVVLLDKNCTEAWWDLAAIRLGRQEFDQAGIAFSHLPKPDAPLSLDSPVDLKGVLDKYSMLVSKEGRGALQKTREEFVHDIALAGHDAWPLRQLALGVFFKNNNRNPQTVNFDLIEKALHWVNADVKGQVLTHESTSRGLKVSMHDSTLRELSPLAGLPISILDVSGTGAMDLAWLGDAPLISVDLSRSSTWDTGPLEQCATLQELRLTGWLTKDYTRVPGLHQIKRLFVDSADIPLVQKALQTYPNSPQVQVIGE